MKRVMVRYKVKADRAEENQKFVEDVYKELHATAPDGLRYATFKLEDGVTFIHVASIETENGENPLSLTEAFKAFQSDLRDRCEELPVATKLEDVGSYRFFEF